MKTYKVKITRSQTIEIDVLTNDIQKQVSEIVSDFQSGNYHDSLGWSNYGYESDFYKTGDLKYNPREIPD